MSRCLAKNIRWFQAYQCWSAVLHSGLWSGRRLSELAHHITLLCNQNSTNLGHIRWQEILVDPSLIHAFNHHEPLFSQSWVIDLYLLLYISQCFWMIWYWLFFCFISVSAVRKDPGTDPRIPWWIQSLNVLPVERQQRQTSVQLRLHSPVCLRVSSTHNSFHSRHRNW